VEIHLLGSGELLERLNRPGNEGRRWFFFQQIALGSAWCRTQFTHAERIADERYTPERHLTLPLGRVIDGLVLTERFRRALTERVVAAYDRVLQAQEEWRGWLDRHGQAASIVLADVSSPDGPDESRWAPLTALMNQAVATATSLRNGVENLDTDRGLAAAATATRAGECEDLLQQFLSETHNLVAILEAHEQAADPLLEPVSDAGGVAALAATPGVAENRPRGPASYLKHLVEDYGAVLRAQGALVRLAAFAVN
jgi:hypothetical protein